MRNDLLMLYKGKPKKDTDGVASEIGIVTGVSPHLTFTINGQEYSSEHFTVYVPAIDRIKQEQTIDCTTPDHVKGTVAVDIGDLEMEPDSYERLFLVGDLIDVTDRGDSFVVHGRLVEWGKGTKRHG